MRMKGNVLVKLGLLAFGSIGFSLAQTPVLEHWSPYDYPSEIPEGAKYHIIVDGDTLWGIAQQYFQDPFVWPQIYQANPYIKDPDLIYPGDPVLLDIGVVVTSETIADDLGDSGSEMESGDEMSELTEFAEDGETGDQVSDRAQTTSMIGSGGELVIIPAGDRNDIECSTYIFPVGDKDYELPFTISVAGGEYASRESFASEDIVYLNKGAQDGVQAGDEFGIRRELGLVRLPDKSRELVGVAIGQIGKLRVIAVQETGSTAMITKACSGILRGDFLVPFEQEPIPLITELPPFDRWGGFPKEGSAYIVYTEDRVESIGKGHLANVNLGVLDNVAPGDIFIVYRENPSNDEGKDILLPDIYLGQAVALRSGETTSVVKIIESVDVIHLGDLVVPYRN